MSDYAFLIEKNDPAPVFRASEASDLAYACAWMPAAWLAFFELDDIVLTRQNAAEAAEWNAEPARCFALHKERAGALATFARRKARLERCFPAYLAPLLDALEKTVSSAHGSYIQVVVEDLDQYISFPDESEGELRANIAALDSDDWSGVIRHCRRERLRRRAIPGR